MSNVSEHRWARSTYVPPRHTRDTITAFAIAFLYAAIVPPLAVILWRIALWPWP